MNLWILLFFFIAKRWSEYMDAGINLCLSSGAMKYFFFYLEQNSWEKLNFSGDVRIHKDSFLSVFHISGLPDEYYYNGIIPSLHVDVSMKECSSLSLSTEL
mgnify:CR=1 FL=1